MLSSNCEVRLFQLWKSMCRCLARSMPMFKEMTAVGLEPTPLRTGALSQRLRPLGQTVLRHVVDLSA